MQPEHQTKLNEWKEYHGYQHSRVKKWERRLEAAQKALKLVRERVSAGEFCREQFWGREGQLSFATRKYEEAKPILEWVEQELPTVISEGGLGEREQFEYGSIKVREQSSTLAFYGSKFVTGLVVS